MTSIDIEVTNRCNAKCNFCPRDATPHQGLMAVEVFEQSLQRAVELRDLTRKQFPGGEHDVTVSLCGLGEPLLHRQTPDFVRQVRDAGIECGLSSNGALLDEKRGRALLDAGLTRIFINVGDRDEAYEEVYRLPFERTHDNVVRFAEMAGSDCEVFLVLVNYRADPAFVLEMKDYWRARGIHAFVDFEIMNRGGTLFVDHMQFEAFPELDRARSLMEARGVQPLCVVPFLYLFIGYDGQYYLCCSDWTKAAPLGSVFDFDFLEITQRKLAHITSREPICKTCNHDPLNRLTEELRAVETGEADEAASNALVEELAANTEALQSILAKLGDRAAPRGQQGPTRKLIPVAAE